jgi:hypothetical protein
MGKNNIVAFLMKRGGEKSNIYFHSQTKYDLITFTRQN